MNEKIWIVGMGLFLWIAGCRPACPPSTPSGPETTEPPHKESAEKNGFMRCKVEMIEYRADHPWHDMTPDPEGRMTTSEHGTAPRVTFRVVQPEKHARKVFHVLYKYTGKDTPPALDPSRKGNLFSMDVPAGFFDSDHDTIENVHIGNFAPVSPTPAAGRPQTADVSRIIALSLAELDVQVKNPSEYKLIKAEQNLVNGRFVWRITFKLARLLPADPSTEIIGAGGEIFMDIDPQTRKITVRHGE